MVATAPPEEIVQDPNAVLFPHIYGPINRYFQIMLSSFEFEDCYRGLGGPRSHLIEDHVASSSVTHDMREGRREGKRREWGGGQRVTVTERQLGQLI